MKIVQSLIETPWTGKIPNELEEGTQITVRGRVGAGTSSFAINLQEKKNPGEGEIALHFNPRLSDNVVVRNTFSGGWGQEERDSPNSPFRQNEKFTLVIEVSKDAFKTHVNGKPFINFAHRLSLKKVEYIYLTDGADYDEVVLQERPKMPYYRKMIDSMRPGTVVKLEGSASDDSSFSVNFAADAKNQQCAFHFNPRPKDKTVVRNSHLGKWGNEEKGGNGFPFEIGHQFEAVFLAEDDKFTVYVNNKFFADFKYRTNVHDVNYIILVGGLHLTNLSYGYSMGDKDVKRIRSGLKSGDAVIFDGIVKPGGNTFSINFLNGTKIGDDIAFHFNPRLNQKEIVMNSCFGGNWGGEEKVALPSAFANREPFQVKVITKEKKFKVFVNDEEVAKFKARGKLSDIKGVNVAVDAFVYNIQHERNPGTPNFTKIPGGLREGGWIVLKGYAKKKSDGFSVNFQCGDEDQSDNAFHFNPRFADKCVVFNSYNNGWQNEERPSGFPFKQQRPFRLAFWVQKDKYVCYVNWKHFAEFKHRIPIDKVNFLSVKGNVDAYEPDFLW